MVVTLLVQPFLINIVKWYNLRFYIIEELNMIYMLEKHRIVTNRRVE